MKKGLVLIFIIGIAVFFSYTYRKVNSSNKDISNKSNIEVENMEKNEIESTFNEEGIVDQGKLQKKMISEKGINLDTDFKYPIILDTHNDTMMKVLDDNTWLPTVDLGENTPFHIDIPKLQSSGLNILFFAAFTEGYKEDTGRSRSRTLALINALYFTEKNNSNTFKIAKNLNGIVDAVNEGKIAAVPTIEGAYSLDEDYSLDLLHQYNDLGIKAIGLTWNYSNKLGEGASRIYGDKDKTKSSGGLTEHGKNIVHEMNRLGMIVDVSHMAKSTFWDVINASTSPVIASHSGVDNIKEHNRNLNDQQLKALADNGGVISIVFYPEFLKNGDGYISDIVDHIDYVVNLIGIDHVGIGSDFDGARMPKDLKDSSEIYKIREELINRTYSGGDIEKILGKNILRVLKEVEDKADRVDFISNIEIVAEFNMGEKLDSNRPVLRAKISADKGIEDASIIVDGFRYRPIFDEINSSISLQIKEPLEEKFHLATFEVKDKGGSLKRETRIFYK